MPIIETYNLTSVKLSTQICGEREKPMFARFWKSRFWKNAAVIGFVTLLVVEVIAHVAAGFITGAV